MKPYFEDNLVKIFNKDCRDMGELPDSSVQCVVTSPPYLGLRKYKGEQDLIWGGKQDCQHKWMAETKTMEYVQGNPEFARPHREHKNFTAQTNTCSLCGAWRGAYGLELTPEMYIEHTILFLREIRRVLRKDGVVFLNLGDSYWGGKGQSGSRGAEYQGERHDRGESLNTEYQTLGGTKQTKPTDGKHPFIKPKDLCLIPFRVAIAAQEDGWWVRSVIIWSKPNPMPESCKDRPTESHEYILMLTKSAHYYWDMDAIREPNLPQSIKRAEYPVGAFGSYSGDGEIRQPSKRTGKTVMEQLHPSGRNIRTVWTFATEPYPEAHFATFPTELPKRCILAATSEKGNCSKCGKPWVRISEKSYEWQTKGKTLGTKQKQRNAMSDSYAIPGHAFSKVETLGWKPQCGCNAPAIPALVLDPFSGSGTTLMVAKQLGRKAIGIETSAEYCKLCQRRVEEVSLPMLLA